jgi:hypothetical protein
MASDQGNANLSAGRQAVTYVKSRLKLGAANNPFKLQSSVVGQLRAMDGILKVWRAEDDAMESNFVNPADGLRMAQAFADSAERYGAGNCGEHSAVAYMWLRRNGVYPVDWVHFKNKDHAFVLIGRSKTGNYTAKQIPEQPWFNDAVVCDAYWGRCDFWSKLFTDYNPENIIPIHHQEAQNELQQWINK